MASLKDQLDQAGYDTSTLDEGAVMKQLTDAGYDVSGFTPSQSLEGVSEMPTMQDVKDLWGGVGKAGRMVKGGYSGVADLISGKGLPQASSDVQAVQAGMAPATTPGKVGEFLGSFFTPGQIALTAMGEAAAKPVLAGLNKVGSLLAPATEAELPGTAKAAGNLLSTASGVKLPELETVMTAGRDAVQGAKTFPELAESVADSMNKLTDHIGTLEKSANAALDAKNTFPSSLLSDAVENELRPLMETPVPTPATESTKNTLLEMMQKLENQKDFTEPDVAKWVKEVQGKINWNDPMGTDLNTALTRIQNTVNGALKDANPEYGKALDQFADAVNLKNDLSQAMGVSKEAGFGGKFTPENVSVTKLKGLLNPDNALATKKLLGDFSQVPGVPNYVDLAKQTSAKAALGQGWRARLAGLLAGAIPGAGRLAANTISGGLTAAPSAANAVVQGLTQ